VPYYPVNSRNQILQRGEQAAKASVAMRTPVSRVRKGKSVGQEYRS